MTVPIDKLPALLLELQERLTGTDAELVGEARRAFGILQAKFEEESEGRRQAEAGARVAAEQMALAASTTYEERAAARQFEHNRRLKVELTAKLEALG